MYEENPLITKSGTDVSFHFSRFMHKERDAVLTVPATVCTVQCTAFTIHCPQHSSSSNESSDEKNAFHTDWLDAEAPVKGV